jgi:long-chain acyl-CoA synthetase
MRDGNVQRSVSRSELETRARLAALGLAALGISPGEKVAIIHDNGPGWIVADLAVSAAGAVTVPVYTTLGTDETAFILKDSGAVSVICSPGLVKKVLDIKERYGPLPIRHVISTCDEGGGGGDGGEGGGENTPEGRGGLPGTLTFGAVSSLGRDSGDPGEFSQRLLAIEPDDPFSIIYTSGTTGRAKGVVLTHANILSNIKASLSALDITPDDVYLSYLPLSHIFERMVHHLMLYRHSTVAYSKGFAYVGADIGVFRPTIMVGVPFFFDRVRTKLMDGVEKSGPVKKALFALAMEKNKGRYGRSYLSRFPLGVVLDRIILKKVRQKLAPGLKFFISGGAALARDTAEFFWALGVPILEGYGLTETSPVVSVNTVEAVRPWTVGRPVEGVEVRISGGGDREGGEGGEGEILVKGPNVMKGYHNMPGATEEAVRDGWFHTGDTGRLDPDGFISITDRKKDIIVTSVGKNVSPQRIETLLRTDEFIKEALVFGDGRTHLVALIVPEAERLESEGLELGETAERVEDPAIKGIIEKRVRERLKTLARFEQIKRFALLGGNSLSQAGGDITPTMKVKRDAVGRRFRDLIESLYD